jgi:hypothetical protein
MPVPGLAEVNERLTQAVIDCNRAKQLYEQAKIKVEDLEKQKAALEKQSK